MKPSRNLFLGSFLVITMAQEAGAAPIIWNSATTIGADSQILTAGSLVYGYTNSTTQAVNGVTFTGVNSSSNWGSGNFTLSLPASTGSSTTAFLTPTGVSTAYGNLTKGAAYGSAGTGTFTFNNLTSGRVYVSQIWVNDSRTTGNGRTETVTSTGGNSVTLDYNSTNAAGGAGQFTLGRFVANTTTQAFTMTSASSVQLNSMQLREVTNIGNWVGSGGATWDASTTNNFASNLFSAALTTTNFGAAKAALNSVTFADSYWNNGTATAVTQTAVTIAAGGVSTGKVYFYNNAVNYSFTSADSNGISGTTEIIKGGSGTVTLGANSHTGGTFVTAGTLKTGTASSLSVGNTALTINGGILDLNGITANQQVSSFDGSGGTILNSVNGTTASLFVGGNHLGGTYSGSIADNAGGGATGKVAFTKIGNGTQILSGSNTYSGGTTVTTGTLNVSGTGSISNGSTLYLGGGSAAANFISGGTVSFSGAVTAHDGVAYERLVQITGGSFSAGSLTLSRAGTNYSSEPTAGATTTGFYMTGGTANISGAMNVTGSNSTSSARLDTGSSLTVGGVVTIGLANTGRWSVFDVNGGSFTSSNTATGVQLGNASAGNVKFLVRGGTADVQKFTFNGVGTTAYSAIISVTGGSLYIGSGGIVTSANAFYDQKLVLGGGTLGASADWSSSVATTLTANSKIQAADSLGVARNITLNGAISGTGFGFTKTGTGMLTLAGPNTYSGDTLFGAAVGTSTGILRLANEDALGTGKLIINNGNSDTGTVELTGNINVANNIDFFGRGASTTAAIIRNVSGDNELSGVLSGSFNGGHYNFHSDAGTLTISNKITSSTTGTRNLNLRGIGAINVSGLIENGSASVRIQALDAGTYTLGGNNTFTGGVTINNGVLRIQNAGALNSTAGSENNVTFGSSTTGTLALLGNSVTISNLEGSAVGPVVTNANGSSVSNSTLTVGNSLNLSGTYAGILQNGTGGGTLALVKAGTGTLTLSGANTYGGGTTIRSGILALSSNATAAGSNGIVIGHTEGSADATLQVGNNLTFADALTVQSGSGGTKAINSVTSGGTPVFSGGVTLNDDLTLNNNASTSSLQFTTNTFALNGNTLNVSSNGSNAGTVTFGSTAPITGTSASTINFGGTTTAAGKFRLSAANTFSGTAALSATSGVGGTLALELNHVNALQNATLDTGASGNQSVSFVVSGTNTYNIGALQGSDDLAIGTNTLSVGSKAGTTTFSGAIGVGATAGGLIKAGSGSTLQLTGTSVYTGATTITDGTLALSGSGSINNSAVIDVQAAGTLSIAGVTTSTSIGASNTQTLKGIGSVDLGSKTLNIGSSGTLAPGASPGTLDFIASVGGKLDFSSGSIIAFELGSTNDLISFNSAGDWLTGSGNATLALSLLGGFDYATTYTIFENVTTTGFTLANITGYDNVGYTANFAQSGNDYNLSFTAIPEPRAAILGLLGTLGLLRRRR